MNAETKRLVEDSNRLAAVVQDLQGQKKRYWDGYHAVIARSIELEGKVLAGDRAVLEDWLEVRRQLQRYVDNDTVDGALRKAQVDYYKAHDSAMTALRRDAGLVWVAGS